MGLWTKHTAIALISASTNMAYAEQCVLQERTVSQTQVMISERSSVRRDVVPVPGGGRKCIVDFRVRIGNQWHTAFGEYTWTGHQPSTEACAIAVSRAEDDVRQRIGKSQTASEKILVCRDRPELQELRNADIGTVGDAGQFRPHPNYPRRFWYNGVQCRWFLEPVFTGSNVKNYQGITCELQPGRWVVVDKF